MRKLILGCVLVALASGNGFGWNIPYEVKELIIGPYVAQNDASFKKVSVKAGEECLVYSDGTTVVIVEDRGDEVLAKINASLIFKVNYENGKGNRPTINLYQEHSKRDNDLCPRGTMVLFKKTDLRELHDIKSLHVESYFQTDRDTRIAAAHKSIGIPEQVKDLNLGYYTAQNSASHFNNFVTEGDKCAVIAKGSEFNVYSSEAKGMMGIRYHSAPVFMYNDAEGASQKVNLYSELKKHNTDICPDGTLLTIPLVVLNEWDESKMASITWGVDREIMVAGGAAVKGPETSRWNKNP
jgi:hypothetical protein